MNSSFTQKQKDLEKQITEVKQTFDMEVKVKDTLIERLRTKNEQLSEEIRRAVQILKYPRLKDMAEK